MHIAEPQPRPGVAVAVALGCAAAVLPFLPWSVQLALGGALLAVPGAWFVISGRRWLPFLFAALLLLPPVPFPIGDAGAHPAIAFAGLAVLGLLTRIPGWRFPAGALSVTLFALLVAMALSLAFAAAYSGPAIALSSLVRLVLFAIGPMVFWTASAGPDRAADYTRPLFWMAAIAAAFGVVDFVYQLPTPAGYENQFLWLESGVYRRAQGLFYESSTLGNFCSFFLVFAAVCFTVPKDRRPVSSPLLLLGAGLLGSAMLLSFSRASVLACLISLATLAATRGVRGRTWRGIAIMLLAAAIVAGVLAAAVPEVSEGYWSRVQLALDTIQDSPDRALSGRLASWATVAGFIQEHPWQTLFGIGYKTLPYTNYLGRPVIADNMYLSLLVETGALGFLALVALNIAILRVSWRALRRGSLHGAWMFCFWTGESLQMLSGDILTYWRVLPIYFWVLAKTVRDAREEA